MGYPPAHLVDPEASGFFHCISRCVRRAWLCSEDRATGLNFDHRRDWIAQRLIDLAQSSAVGRYAWYREDFGGSEADVLEHLE